MQECGLRSVYALFLRVDLPRATLHRYLAGRVRIPLGAASELTEALLEHAARWKDSARLQELDDLIRAAFTDQSAEALLRAELRARGIRIGRTLEALRAARFLPPDTNTPP